MVQRKKDENVERRFRNLFSRVRIALNKGEFDEALGSYPELEEAYAFLENKGKYKEGYRIVKHKMLMLLYMAEVESLLKSGNHRVKAKLDLIGRTLHVLAGQKLKPFQRRYYELQRFYGKVKGHNNFSYYQGLLLQDLSHHNIKLAQKHFEKLVHAYTLAVQYVGFREQQQLHEIVFMMRDKIILASRTNHLRPTLTPRSADTVAAYLRKGDYEKGLAAYAAQYGDK